MEIQLLRLEITSLIYSKTSRRLNNLRNSLSCVLTPFGETTSPSLFLSLARFLRRGSRSSETERARKGKNAGETAALSTILNQYNIKWANLGSLLDKETCRLSPERPERLQVERRPAEILYEEEAGKRARMLCINSGIQ